MTAKEILEKLNNGEKINVIDIRNEVKYNSFHLPGAINLPIGILLSEYEKYLSKSNKYFITCNSGNSAKIAVESLRNNGYEAELVDGGMTTVVTK